MEVHTIAVIGAGTLGRGIAYVAALGGFRTILEDVSHPALDQSLAWIQSTLDQGISRGEIEAQVRDAALANIRTACTVEDAIRDADLVIEAVAEEMEMKIELFTLFDRFGKPGAIFASNTSSLSITEMATMTFCPQRCLGMHFFDPVPKTKLLELRKALDTSEETMVACGEVARRMGKEVVVKQESPVVAHALVGLQASATLESEERAGVAQGRKLLLSPSVGPYEGGRRAQPDIRLGLPAYGQQALGKKSQAGALPQQPIQAEPLGRKVGRVAHDYPQQKSAGVQD